MANSILRKKKKKKKKSREITGQYLPFGSCNYRWAYLGRCCSSWGVCVASLRVFAHLFISTSIVIISFCRLLVVLIFLLTGHFTLRNVTATLLHFLFHVFFSCRAEMSRKGEKTLFFRLFYLA
jgi:hypothetical protein